jgi:hypothetical protein
MDRETAVRLAWAWGESLELGEWTGKGGASARCCAESMLAWAVRRGGVVFVASLEEIALEAGLSRAAARRGVRRLEAERWVVLLERGDGRRASKWRLIGGGGAGEGCLGGGGEDWTRWGAVGKSGFIIWRYTVAGASVEGIAERRGCSEKWVRRVLGRLEAIGVVEQEGDGQWRACSPDGVAELYGVEGARGAAIERIARTRQERRWPST